MRRNSLLLIVTLVFSLVSTTVFAVSLSPVGNWTTISDKTGKPRSIIKIWKSKNILYGKIIKIYKEPGDTGICKACPGKFKNKKIKDLTIMWGLRQVSSVEWKGGEILDPKSGNIYSCKLQVAQNGKSLTVRGYVGISLFGRSQIWIRDKTKTA